MNSRPRGILEAYKCNADEFIVYLDRQKKDGAESVYRVDLTEAYGTIVEDAGLNGVTPHGLRHTFASQLANPSRRTALSLMPCGESSRTRTATRMCSTSKDAAFCCAMRTVRRMPYMVARTGGALAGLVCPAA
ncbi:MAG: hypothetical protein AMXMBFR82_05350 [Candidatus Hydrogenedentota bacterium]